MKRWEAISIVFSLCTLALLGTARAEEDKPSQAAEAPNRTPEHERMEYFVGKWRCEGELKQNPVAPAAKMNWTETYTWFDGRFALINEYEGQGSWGPVKGQSILGYDTEEKKFVYFGIDNMGHIGKSEGVIEGDTWSFTGERKVGEKVIRFRYCVKEMSPTSRVFWEEMSEDGVSFTRVLDGKGARTE